MPKGQDQPPSTASDSWQRWSGAWRSESSDEEAQPQPHSLGKGSTPGKSSYGGSRSWDSHSDWHQTRQEQTWWRESSAWGDDWFYRRSDWWSSPQQWDDRSTSPKEESDQELPDRDVESLALEAQPVSPEGEEDHEDPDGAQAEVFYYFLRTDLPPYFVPWRPVSDWNKRRVGAVRSAEERINDFFNLDPSRVPAVRAIEPNPDLHCTVRVLGPCWVSKAKKGNPRQSTWTRYEEGYTYLIPVRQIDHMSPPGTEEGGYLPDGVESMYPPVNDPPRIIPLQRRRPRVEEELAADEGSPPHQRRRTSA